MDDRKIRIGIIPGAETTAADALFTLGTFAAAEIFEICTPILYIPEETFRQLPSLKDLETACNTIPKASAAQGDTLNIIIVPTQGGEGEGSGGDLSANLFRRAMDDRQQGYSDVIVAMPRGTADPGPITEMIQDIYNTSLPMPIMLTEKGRLVNALPAAEATQTGPTLKEQAERLYDILRRDFAIDAPRIAFISKDGTLPESPVRQAVCELIKDGKPVFGPYETIDFSNQDETACFDAFITTDGSQTISEFAHASTMKAIWQIGGLGFIITVGHPYETGVVKERFYDDDNWLRTAIYSAIDTFRNRRSYDLSHVNPLRKTYHEKREDGERSKPPYPKFGETAHT